MAAADLNKEEEILKFLYENNITIDNIDESRALIRNRFNDDESYYAFIENYLKKTTFISAGKFMLPGQRIDVFEHTRYMMQVQHTHDFLEIKCMVRGSGILYMGESAYLMKESDLCFILPYTPHSSAIFDSDSRMINIVVTIENIPAVFSRLMNIDHPIQKMLMDAINKIDFSIKFLYYNMAIDYKSETIITELLNYYRGETVFSELGYASSEADLEAMLLHMIKKDPAADDNPHKNNFIIKKVFTYIDSNYADASLSGLSEYLQYSESYTSRLIKKYTGKNFYELLRTARLKKAGELLQSTSFSVEEILNILGINGKTNFYNNFKEYYHLTPKEFRNENIKK